MIMLRTPNKPLTKNNRIVIVYLFLFIATLSMNVVLALAEQRFITPIVVAAFWVIDIAVFFSIWRSSSSYIERDPDVPFVQLLETFDPESLCPFCRVIRLPQSRHCNICNRCVERYDHHCPWVNNCVGRTNHANFYAHLILVVLYCIGSLVNACISLFGHEADNSSSSGVSLDPKVPEALRQVSIFTLLAFGVVFGVLVLVLVVY
mmetsp:Transcript_27499/g.36769  ORF Transcript_27499/g.36769 Transcript_27499/m.36769 type:complete len:205 (+) Transcript_27499:1880-2494(+)